MSKGVDKEQLMRYIEVEKKIKELETKGFNKDLNTSEKNIKDIEETIKTVEAELGKLKIQTLKEKKDVDDLVSLKNTVQNQAHFDQKMSKEQAEYLEALNKEEVANQQLQGLKKQKADMEAQHNSVKSEVDKMNKVYEERDTLLSNIFGGEYGSELENKLEAEYDEIMDKKQRIEVAMYKWKNGRCLLHHGVQQLGRANELWNKLPEVPQKDKYGLATECRNNLIAAKQNVDSTQRYLDTIKFPYCEPAEMVTLGRATDNIYTDMADPNRHRHAGCCYDVTYRRSAALLQWFDSVIEKTIAVDLNKTKDRARTVEQALRAERIKLIRDKIKESGGDVGDLNDAGLKGITDQSQMKETEQEKISVVEPMPVDDTDLPKKEMELDNRPPPTPLPLSELAPIPSEEDIFGDISQLKEAHRKNEEEFRKAQDLNKARMEQGLQAKLAQRRHRRH